MANTTKRLLSFALALVMVLGLFPVIQTEAKAAETSTSTVSAPYYVGTTRKQHSVDLDLVNEDLVIDDPDGDGTGTAYCQVCGGERTWVKVTNELQTDVAWKAIADRGTTHTELHYYVTGDVVSAATNIDSNGAAANADNDGSFFWLWIRGGQACVHIAEGASLQVSKGIYVSEGTLNLMGKGTLKGGYHYDNIRGAAITMMGWNSTANIFGTTIQNVNSATPNVIGLGSGGYYSSSCAFLNIYRDAVIEGDIYQRVGQVNLYGGEIYGRTFITAYRHGSESSGTIPPNYTKPKFTVHSGKVVGIGSAEDPIVKEDLANGGDYGGGTFAVFNGATLDIKGGEIVGGWLGETGIYGSVIYATGAVERSTLDGKTYYPGVTNVNISGDAVIRGQGYYDAEGKVLPAEQQKTTGASGAIHLWTNKDYKTDGLGVQLTMTGGTIYGANTIGAGGAIHCDRGTVNISAGTVYGGSASGGGAIRTNGVSATVKSKLNLSGTAVVRDGKTIGKASGGNISATNTDVILSGDAQILDGVSADAGGNMMIYGGACKMSGNVKIMNGRSAGGGGNMFVHDAATFKMEGGLISGGVAGPEAGAAGVHGGNVYISKNGAVMNMTGGTVTLGVCNGKDSTGWKNNYTGGGNIAVGSGSTLHVTNATISAGTATYGSGGNIMGHSNTTININSGAKVFGGVANQNAYPGGGGNIQASTGNINVYAGAEIYGGVIKSGGATDVGGIYGTKVKIYGGTIGEPGNTARAIIAGELSDTIVPEVYIYGGTIYGTMTKSGTGAVLSVSHGTFSASPNAAYLASGAQAYTVNNMTEVHTPGAAADCDTAQTCTTEGCGKELVAALGHQLGDWVNGVKTCTRCTVYTETCPHTNTEQVGEVTATCVTDGRTADTKCTECGVVTVSGHEIPKDSIPHGTAYKAADNADQHIKYCPVEGCTWSETESHTYTDGKCVCDAAEPQKVLKGSGTEEDPYQIGTLEELIIFRDDVNTKTTVYGAAGVYVALTDNIDMSGIDWSKNIGDAADFSFAGIFDGRDHIITGLNSKETATDPYGYVCTGLFGCIEGDAVIKNLTIKEANIQADFVGNNAGFVVGFAYLATGTIENVHIVDSTMNAPAVTGTGAIVGYDWKGKLTIKNCSVENTDVVGAAYVGGVIGYAYSNCTISGCTFEDGDVKATSCCAGGIAGIMLGNSKAENNTVKNAQITADHANWQNSAAVVVGCITGGKVTVSGTVAENVNLTALVGSQHTEKPTTPVAKVQAVIGNDYYGTFAAAIKAAEAGQTVTLLDDVTLTEPVVATGKTVDLNGKTLTGDILATISVNNGAYNNIVGAANALCQSTDAVFSIEGASANITLISGTMKQVADMNIGANQTMTVLEGATYELPANVKLTIQGAVIAEGTLELEGSVVLTSVKATFQATENLEVTTTVSDYEVSYANGVYSLKHKPVVVVKPEVEDIVVGNGDTEVTEEQKEAVKDVIEQVAQNQASAKVETGLVTNETANNKLKEELQTKDPEITEEKLEEAVKNAQTAVVITPTAVVLNESNKATKLTYEVEPVLLYEDVKVKIEVTDVVTFRLPVPDYIVVGTLVKVYHDKDLLGFYTVQTDGEGHNYVEVESKEFSPYTVELSDAVALLDEVEYTSFLDAMEAAAVNGGTVKLLQNVGVSEILMVMDNVTLDLNGFTLSSSSYVMAVFENSYIIDSSEGKTGRLNMDISKLRLLDANKQMAAQTEGGVMFADVKLEGKWSAKNNCFKFWFADTTDAAFINALKDGSEASKLKVLVELKWNGGANKMTYVFTDANLNDYLANWQAYSLTLSASGASSIADLSYTAKVIFADGAYAEVSAAAAAVSHGAQQ